MSEIQEAAKPPVSTARLERIAEVMRLIQTDCEADALGLDGTAFTGRGVGEQFGNVLAAISALAAAVEVLTSAQATFGRSEGVQS